MVFEIFRLFDDEELKSMIDQGLVTLIKRGFGVRPPLEREEREVQSRINDSGNLDNQRTRQVIPFLAPAPLRDWRVSQLNRPALSS